MTSIVTAGLDVGFTNDYMALVLVRYDYDKIRLSHLATWRKIDWHLWKEDMKTKLSRFGIDTIYVDSTNNKSVVFELQEMGMNVEGISFSNSSKRDMVQNARKLIMTGEFVFPVGERLYSPRQRQLFEELFSQLREQEFTHGTVNPKLGHPSGRHDDLLWALCLALYGTKNDAKGEPFLMTFSNDDFPPYYGSDRSSGSGLGLDFGNKVTSVKIRYPGESDYSSLSF